MGRLKPIEWGALAIAAVLYTVFAYISVTFTRGVGGFSLFWLPGGFLIGWLLRRRRAMALPAVLLCLVVQLCVFLTLGYPMVNTVARASAHALDALLTLVILRRGLGARPDMAQPRSHLWLLAAVSIAVAIGSVVAGFLVLGQPGTFEAGLALRWFAHNALSLLLILPITVVMIDLWRGRAQMSVDDWRHIAMTVGVVSVGTLVVFSQTAMPFLFLVSPLLLYGAFRAGLAGSAFAIIAVTVIAAGATFFGHGPIMLVRGGAEMQTLALQVFLVASFLMCMPVAAILHERDRERRAAAAARDEIREIVDNVRDIIFRTNAAGEWTALNRAWEDVTGYSVEESLGTPTTTLLHPDDIAETRVLYPRLAAGEIDELLLEQHFIARDAKIRNIVVKVRRVVDAQGQFAGTIGNIADVTDMVERSHALARSEENFRLIAQNTPVGLFRADPNGHLTYMSPNWMERLGRKPGELLGDGWLKTLADVSMFRDQPIWLDFKPGEVRRRRIPFRAVDSGVVWMDVYTSAEFDDDGKVVEYNGAAVDITEQREALERLGESEQRFQALTNLSPAGIFRTDPAAMLTDVNPTWLRQSGLAANRWRGRAWLAGVHAGDRERVVGALLNLAEHGGEARFEYRWVHRDRSQVIVDVQCQAELDAAGRTTGIVGVAIDVTDRHRAAEALAASEEELRLITDNVTDSVLRLGLDGVCLYASPSVERLFELPASALIGHVVLTEFHPDDEELVEATFARLTSGESDSEVIAFRSRSPIDRDRYRWMEASCALIRDAAWRPKEVLASLRDVSRNKALEAQLRAAQASAEAATTAKSAFLANMSHELRTPMNGVIGYTNLLAETDLSAQQREQVEAISESSQAMMTLLNDILDLSKIEAGQMEIVNEPFDLPHKLRGAVRLVESVARAKQIQLSVDVDPALPRWIAGDALRLRQIVLNLVGNAVKFTQHGGVEVAARKAADGKTFTVAVKDTGMGIAPENLTAIFEQFAQADNSIARRFGGTGLGLSICSRLAAMMGGSITVESTVGEGSTFTLTLPLEPAVAPSGVDSGPAGDAAGSERQIAGAHLLVVEDNAINRGLIAAILGAVGIKPAMATNGREAIDAVEAAAKAGAPFDLVLMDVQMPEIDGLAATRHLRNHGFDPATLPIVALTANAFAEDIAQCRAAGMQAHLAKPIVKADLYAAIARHRVRRLGTAQALEEQDANQDLEAMYERLRGDFLAHLAAARQDRDADTAALQSLAHQVAGTAALFGEAALAEAAANLDRALRTASSVTDCRAAVAQWDNAITAAAQP
ncbi:PAS domain S-box protein [Parablastomonas sp. CN1-191]|uniref:PAS domain S-box protein n=1 Tax=Parablastomonas sp. CN1-191 TaxID=3400908 RepID=UPI003BF85182